MPSSRRRALPGPAAPSKAELTVARRTRALEEALDVRPRPGSLSARFEVRNVRHASRYSVFLPEFPRQEGAMCNCTDFGRRGLGTCKHIESVVLWISEHPSEGGPSPSPFDGRGIWGHADRLIEHLVGLPRVDPRSLRVPGSALVDRTRHDPVKSKI